MKNVELAVATAHDQIANSIKTNLTLCDKYIADYSKAVEEMGIEYAIEFKTESLYRAKVAQKEFLGLKNLIEKRPELFHERINRLTEQKIESLLEGNFVQQSTSQISNLMYTWKALEQAQLIKVLQDYSYILSQAEMPF